MDDTIEAGIWLTEVSVSSYGSWVAVWRNIIDVNGAAYIGVGIWTAVGYIGG